MKTKMSSDTQLIIQFEGLEQDGGEVRLDYLTEELASLQKALQISEKNITDSKIGNLVYKVVAAKHESPLSVTIEATLNDQAQTRSASLALDNFFNALSRKLMNPAIENDSDTQIHRAIDSMIQKSQERFSSVEIERKGKKVQLIDNMQTELERMISKNTNSWGTVKGRVERYNNHGDSNFFWLYTTFGKSVKCKFPTALVEQSALSVERNVSVTGMMTYRANEPMPFECKVEKIEIHKPDDQLPELEIGKFPEITGSESTTQVIQRIRDDWE